MLMFLILLLIIASITGFYWHQKRSVTNNRYRKNTRKVAPTLDNKKNTVDTDAVLGIHTPDLSKNEITQESAKTVDNTQDVKKQPIVVYLMAPKEQKFGGYELLQVLLSAGLRFGRHQIFHRHEHKDGRGAELFHCASAEKPGVFDPARMGGFETCGLCFFFEPDSHHDALTTFDLMLDTIDQLIEELGGVVYDDQHQVFTKENMVKYRQRIRGIEECNTTADLFAEIE